MKILIKCSFIIILLLSSCLKQAEKDDLIQSIPISQGVQVATIFYGKDYSNQTYFSLANNKAVSTNKITDFDLLFDNHIDQWIVSLNIATGMKAANTNSQDFASINSSDGLDFKFDSPDGRKKALNGWTDNKNVYIINRGIDEKGKALGFFKIQFKRKVDDQYIFQYAKLNKTSGTEVYIKKDYTRYQTAFSFDKDIVIIQPKKQSYDIVFTQYYDLLTYFGVTAYYSVRGVLIQSSENTKVAFTNKIPFEKLDKTHLNQLSFETDLDVIGYDWKDLLSIETGNYIVLSQNVYIIERDYGGGKKVYYKLHFISYTDENGQKGYPQFEFEKLIK